MNLKKINIFISHQHEDATRIPNVIDMIEKKGNYEVRDSSIYEQKNPNKANNPDYIKSLIRGQIDWAGTVIVLIGDKTKNSDYVDYEIKYAGKNDKRVIGVFLPGSSDNDIPEALKIHGSALCRMGSTSLNKALNDDTTFEDNLRAVRNISIGFEMKHYLCN